MPALWQLARERWSARSLGGPNGCVDALSFQNLGVLEVFRDIDFALFYLFECYFRKWRGSPPQLEPHHSQRDGAPCDGTLRCVLGDELDLVLAGYPAHIPRSGLAVRHDNVALGQSPDRPQIR